MYAARSGNLLAIRLELMEDVHASILEACRQHEVRGGFVTSGIGMLEDPELGYFIAKGQYDSRVCTGRYELLTLAGNVSEKFGELMAHLHVICADKNLNAFGGHLISARVGVTLELAISVVEEPVRMYRELETDTGLPGLLVE
jgi:predicted DNA-binding protein with PD1-like motif